MNLGKYRIEYRSNWPLLASLDTFRKAWTVSITDHVQLILVINRGTRIEYYANKFSTLIPIKPLGLIVHSLCFQGVNVFAIECIRHGWMPYRRQNGWQYSCYKSHVRLTICPGQLYFSRLTPSTWSWPSCTTLTHIYPKLAMFYHVYPHLP